MKSTSLGIDLLDALAAEGRSATTAAEVRDRLGLSAQAASNLLARLVRDGFAERVRRGEYILQPLGELGVSAVAGDRLAEAVLLAVGDRSHRICYRTALYEHGLLTRPGRAIQVAVDRRLRVRSLGGRPLESIIEDTDRIDVGAESLDVARISSVERALLESAQVPRRVGSIATVAEALAGAAPRAIHLQSLASELGLAVGLRRLVSLDQLLRIDRIGSVRLPRRDGRPLPLDPTDTRQGGFLDEGHGVLWPGEPAELAEVIGQ
ncbi:MAG: MarR family transcriptional regulator [Acidimicrobiia bacterium]|nr:MarR family transcriptional regulator [Acidimicrobiia bacterium]